MSRLLERWLGTLRALMTDGIEHAAVYEVALGIAQGDALPGTHALEDKMEEAGKLHRLKERLKKKLKENEKKVEHLRRATDTSLLRCKDLEGKTFAQEELNKVLRARAAAYQALPRSIVHLVHCRGRPCRGCTVDTWVFPIGSLPRNKCSAYCLTILNRPDRSKRTHCKVCNDRTVSWMPT